MENILFRNLTVEDAAGAAAVECGSLDTSWSEAQIRETLSNDNAVYVVAVKDGAVCGIGSMYCIAGDGQIMNIAVSAEHRRHGIAEGVMTLLADMARAKGCDNITLEVAEDNISAISLYRKCGYSPVGTRKGFYGGVNAIIMEKRL